MAWKLTGTKQQVIKSALRVSQKVPLNMQNGWPHSFRRRKGGRELIRLRVHEVRWSAETPKLQTQVPKRGTVSPVFATGKAASLPVWAGAALGFRRPRFPHHLGCIHAGRGADWVQLGRIGSYVSPPVKMENVLKNKQPKKTRWGSTENQSEEKNTWASVKRNKTAPAQIFMKMITE